MSPVRAPHPFDRKENAFQAAWDIFEIKRNSSRPPQPSTYIRVSIREEQPLRPTRR